MSNEFVREERYIVFKVSDVERYLTDADRAYLAMMKSEIDAGRDCANKPPFKGLIVESDWPEYEPTWRAIEARATGAPYESAVQVAARIMNHELIAERDALRIENEALRAEVAHVKEVEFPRKAQAVADGWRGKCERLEAKIEQMEQQEPYAFAVNFPESSRVELVHDLDEAYEDMTYEAYEVRKLYLAPGAQPAPSEKDEPIRKAWARFSNALHRSPDAPYPGMSEAFEKHFSQSFTDREWRAESGTWAAAWKAAKRHEAQAQPAPIIPEGWLHAIDEALVVAHIGVANANDTYEQAKAKLDNLIGLHVDVATDPAVNGGWKLVPVEPTKKMIKACTYMLAYEGNSPQYIWAALLAAVSPEPRA